MKKVVVLGALTVLFFLSTPTTQAQDADDVAKLRKENELLKKEIEQLKKEIDSLKKPSKAQPDDADGGKTAAKELELLRGTWNIDSMEWGSKGLPKDLMGGYKFVFDGNKLIWEGAIGMMSRAGRVSAIDDAVHNCEFKIDASQEPKQIDITLQANKRERTFRAIYEIKGDTLKICYFANDKGRRPAEFVTKEGVNTGLIVMTRAKK
ncbi:MAG TPA: TIGR03067 domain-containing protein [Gemmataceae bacterium]|jgi:uncharacterized protein (TIGR03067 family)|nr:TIGR03067 domain-containing protein [Gemmataceae bacterium]